MHDRATGCQRWSNLPGRKHEGCVPRGDHTDGAERLPAGEVDVVFVRHRPAVVRIRCVICEEPEVLSPANGGSRHEANGLAGVDTFDCCDVVGSSLDQVGNAVENLLAFLSGAARPVGERVVGRTRCGIDISRIARGNQTKQRRVDRRVVLKRLTAHTGCRHTADEVLQRGAFEALNCRQCDRLIFVEGLVGSHVVLRRSVCSAVTLWSDQNVTFLSHSGLTRA